MKLKTLEKRITCLNRYLGRCKDCKEDYDKSHYPNNYDCKNYMEIFVYTIKIEELEDKDKEMIDLFIKLYNLKYYI
jgi:hypothetical protein